MSDVHLEVGPGEVFGLLGQNGAGKTTLFKILATLILPDTGSASVCGFDVTRDPNQVREALTPVIPNERSLHWRLSARENLRLYAALHEVPRKEERRTIDEILHVVGLEGAGEKQVGLFSSGMRQRLLVARALLSRPRVLLLDEPTRSLDPVSARDFRAFIREDLRGRHGCTVLLATHDPEEVADLCHRVGILDGGRLIAVGETDALVRDLHVHRYRIWTRTPDHPELMNLAAGWRADRIAVESSPPETGWTRIGFDLPDGPERAADLLRHLATSGVSISRFEKVELPLAELIERATARDRERSGAGFGEETSGRRSHVEGTHRP